MLDKIKDFRETISERIKSPFIGSFMISWSIIHWKIFAFFLYNEDKITIQERIGKVDLYIESETFCSLIINPILITLAVLVSYSVLNAIGLFIKLLYDNWASPYIQKWMYNENIIEKSKYEKIKREYATLKTDYDLVREGMINNDKEKRELKNNFENYRNTSFEGRPINDIRAILNERHYWENSHIYPDGTIGNELFKSEIDGFLTSDGKKIKIDHIKISNDNKILFFNKIIDDKILPNFLIKDNFGNYYGVENNNIIIKYRKRNDNLIIHYAKYYSEEGNNDYDVTEKINELIRNNILEFVISNELMGGDPRRGSQKKLEISYSFDNNKRIITGLEGKKIKLENLFRY